MPAAYPKELRERAIQTYLAGGGTYDEVADRFCVGRATINRWINRFRETGSVEPLPHGGGPPRKLDEEHRGQLLAAVEEKPDATREELREKLCESSELDVSVWTIGRELRRANLTVKKSRSLRRSARGQTFRRSARSSRLSWRKRTRNG